MISMPLAWMPISDKACKETKEEGAESKTQGFSVTKEAKTAKKLSMGVSFGKLVGYCQKIVISTLPHQPIKPSRQISGFGIGERSRAVGEDKEG